MKRNASISYKKAEPEEADAIYDGGNHVFFGSPFGVLIIAKGLTTREESESGPCQPIRSKKKYR